MPHKLQPSKSNPEKQLLTYFLTDFVLAPPPPLSSAEEAADAEEVDAFNDAAEMMLFLMLLLRATVATSSVRLLMLLPRESWLTELMLLLTFWTTSRAKEDLNMDEGEIVVACSSRMNSRISTSGFCKK